MSASTSFYGMVSERTRIWIDIFGIIFFLLPICVILDLLHLAVVPRVVPHGRESSATPAAWSAGR